MFIVETEGEYLDEMYYTFYGCSHLKEVKMPNLKTNNVRTMVGLFQGCSALEEINLLNFDASSLTTMIGMFRFKFI